MKNEIIKILEEMHFNYDRERRLIQHEFRTKTPEQIESEFGIKGRTCEDVCKPHDDRCAKLDACIEWLNSVQE